MRIRRSLHTVLMLVVCATLCSSRPAFAQFTQQGSKLVGSDGTGSAAQGTAVAISADGTTAIVGGPSDNGFAGAAWIWTRNSAGVWTQQGAKLVGSGAVGSGQQGTSVAISADGNTAAIGAPLDNANAGAVWIWTRSAGVWTQQGAKLTGAGATGAAQQGYSVAVSADGNTLIVGAQGDNTNAGAVWVWTRSGSTWTQQGLKLVGSGATGAARQGWSVALASDGNTAVVGGRADNAVVGAAWVWTRSAGVWTQQGSKLAGSDSVGTASQGWAVSLASDGNTATVGGNGDNSSVGAAWIWTRSSGTWTQQGPKLVGSGAVGAAQQGASVSLSGAGNTAIVGGNTDNAAVGAMWVWTRSSATWTQQGSKIVGSGAVGSAQQGYSAALSGDGLTAIVGGPADNAGAGAAWIFSSAAAPMITTHPASQTVAVGATVTFTAAATGNPTPTVQWQISTNGGSVFTDISGATSTSYSFTAAMADNGNRYRAVFTNSAGSATTNDALLTVTFPPAIVTHPTNQTVAAGSTATFTASATGSPAPVVQWQVSTNAGVSFSDVAGATSTTYSFAVTTADNGKRFRAVFTNSGGSATTNAATLTVSLPTMSFNRTSLRFSAVTTGSAFSSSTPPQTVRLSQSGTGTVTWTAASNVPWLVVSPSSGTGGTTLTIATQFAPGLAASQTGQITFTFSGAGNTAGPIIVTLTTVSSSSPASLPFGSFDTPAGDATVLAGSVAVTGWALDNIGVQRLELWRDLQPGETTAPFASTPTDPRNGKVFIADATFVDGARPDVEGINPSTPLNYRAGWGYLMLTWGLWNQGNGSYRLYAFAFDQENNVATIGTKTIVVNNNAATKPFGSIDTPGVGGDASGPNFGWALTPKVNGVATCKIQSNGVQFSIDSGPLQPVIYGDFRADIATAFPGYSNTAAAGGHNVFDWTTLTNGVHTIGWLVTDDCNRTDGIGSRFFNVTTGTSLIAGVTPVAAASGAAQTESQEPITVARGHGELPAIVTGESGSRIVEIKQGERIEMRLPRGFESASQLVNGGQVRDLPVGATWDASSGIFSWEPAPGFLGGYRLVFSNGSERISVRVVVRP
jgi:hypothetical protein